MSDVSEIAKLADEIRKQAAKEGADGLLNYPALCAECLVPSGRSGKPKSSDQVENEALRSFMRSLTPEEISDFEREYRAIRKLYKKNYDDATRRAADVRHRVYSYYDEVLGKKLDRKQLGMSAELKKIIILALLQARIDESILGLDPQAS